jgi:hypothetical protein
MKRMISILMSVLFPFCFASLVSASSPNTWNEDESRKSNETGTHLGDKVYIPLVLETSNHLGDYLSKRK